MAVAAFFALAVEQFVGPVILDGWRLETRDDRAEAMGIRCGAG
jgi:hypothetical protein